MTHQWWLSGDDSSHSRQQRSSTEISVKFCTTMNCSLPKGCSIFSCRSSRSQSLSANRCSILQDQGRLQSCLAESCSYGGQKRRLGQPELRSRQWCIAALPDPDDQNLWVIFPWKIKPFKSAEPVWNSSAYLDALEAQESAWDQVLCYDKQACNLFQFDLGKSPLKTVVYIFRCSRSL